MRIPPLPQDALGGPHDVLVRLLIDLRPRCIARPLSLIRSHTRKQMDTLAHSCAGPLAACLERVPSYVRRYSCADVLSYCGSPPLREIMGPLWLQWRIDPSRALAVLRSDLPHMDGAKVATLLCVFVGMATVAHTYITAPSCCRANRYFKPDLQWLRARTHPAYSSLGVRGCGA